MNLKKFLSITLVLSLTSCATSYYRPTTTGYEKRLVWCIKDFINVGVGPPNANTICHNVYQRPITIKNKEVQN